MAVIDPPDRSAGGEPAPDGVGPRPGSTSAHGRRRRAGAAAAGRPSVAVGARAGGGRLRGRQGPHHGHAVLLQRRRGGGQAAASWAPAASASRARSSTAPSAAPRRRRLHHHLSTASRCRSTTGRPARAVQAGPAGGARGPLGRRRPAAVRQRPACWSSTTPPTRPRTATGSSRPIEGGKVPPSTTATTRPEALVVGRAVNLALGTAGDVLGLVASIVRGRHHRRRPAAPPARPGAARPRLHVAGAGRRGRGLGLRHGARPDHPRLHGALRGRQRQHPHPAAVQRGRACGRRSRARSCCGCCSWPATPFAVGQQVPAPPRRPAGRLGPAHHVRGLHLLLRAADGPGQPVQARSTRRPASTVPARTRCCRTTPLMAIHPPMLYLGYVGLHRAVRLRHRRAGHRPGGRGLAGRDPALDPGRLGLPLGRHRARRVVELRGARLGRLLGLGPGGERLVPALADRHRLPALGHGAGAPGHAAGLEPVAAVRHVLAHHPGHVPDPVRACSTACTPSASRPSARPSSASSPWWWAVTIGLIGWRGDQLRSPGRIDSPLSREGAFLANNVLFGAFAFVVLLGTVFPLMVEAVNGKPDLGRARRTSTA